MKLKLRLYNVIHDLLPIFVLGGTIGLLSHTSTKALEKFKKKDTK